MSDEARQARLDALSAHIDKAIAGGQAALAMYPPAPSSLGAASAPAASSSPAGVTTPWHEGFRSEQD